MMRTTLLAFAAAAVFATSAQAVVVDFSDVGTLNVQFATETSGGLDFTSGPGLAYVWDGSSPNSNGTNNLIYGFDPVGAITITKVGGGSFTLNSIDLAVSWYSAVSPNTILVNGSALVIDSTLTTYVLNLTGTSVTITGLASNDGYWTADNIVYNAVPEPASWALMIAGFGMVGAAMRRRKVALAA